MSLFNIDYPNGIELRAGKGLFEELYAKNPATGKMERVIPGGGGGGGGELPYWALPTKANFGKTIVDETGLEVNNTDKTKGITVGPDAITYGDSTGNTVLGKPEARAIGEIVAKEEKASPVAEDKVLVWDTAAAKHKVTPWKPYLGNNEVAFSTGANQMCFLNDRQLLVNNSPMAIQGAAARITSSSIILGTRTAGSSGMSGLNRATLSSAGVTVVDSVSDYTTLDASGLKSSKSSQFVSLDHAKLTDLSKFTEKVEVSVPTSNEKMLLWSPTDKTYSFSAIPSGGGGATLPDYLKTDHILIEDAINRSAHKSNKVLLYNNVNDGPLVHLDKDFVTVGSKSGASGETVNTSKDYLRLSSSDIMIKTSEGTGSLTGSNLAELNRFLEKESNEELSSYDRMVLFDIVNRTYSYYPVPTGGGATLPSYIKPTSILMNGTSAGIIDIDPGVSNTASIGVRNTGGSLPSSATLTSTELRFREQGQPTSISFNYTDVSRAKEVSTLNDKVEMVTPTTAEKMVIWNPTTSEYKYSAIPKASAAPVVEKITVDGANGLTRLNTTPNFVFNTSATIIDTSIKLKEIEIKDTLYMVLNGVLENIWYVFKPKDVNAFYSVELIPGSFQTGVVGYPETHSHTLISTRISLNTPALVDRAITFKLRNHKSQQISVKAADNSNTDVSDVGFREDVPAYAVLKITKLATASQFAAFPTASSTILP